MNSGGEEVGKFFLGKAGLDILINFDLPLSIFQLPGHGKHLIHHLFLVLFLQQSNDVSDHLLELIFADHVVPKKNLVEILYLSVTYLTDFHQKL